MRDKGKSMGVPWRVTHIPETLQSRASPPIASPALNSFPCPTTADTRAVRTWNQAGVATQLAAPCVAKNKKEKQRVCMFQGLNQ